MKLEYQNRTGLLPEHDGVLQGPHNHVRLTVPARETLLRAGASIVPESADGGPQRYTVELADTVPDGLVVVQIFGEHGIAIRLATEPEYPQEALVTYWPQLDFTGCPECGAPLVWYEAAYVPGYRVCARPPHHHVLAR